MKTAIAYLRANDSFEYMNGTTLQQLQAIQNFCDANGYFLLRVFEDVSSKPPTQRPDFRELIGLTYDKKIQIDLLLVASRYRVSPIGNEVSHFEWWFCDHLKIPIAYTENAGFILMDVAHTPKWIPTN